jgi:hypothetical protein
MRRDLFIQLQLLGVGRAKPPSNFMADRHTLPHVYESTDGAVLRLSVGVLLSVIDIFPGVWAIKRDLSQLTQPSSATESQFPSVCQCMEVLDPRKSRSVSLGGFSMA